MAKRDGTIYEAAFRLAALERGLDVFPSEGDYSVIDLVVLNPAGKAYRVQVKGTACVGSSEGKGRPAMLNKYKIVIGRGGEKTGLSATEVDVLACYIAPRDTWFLLPMVRAMGRRSFAFFVVEGSKSQWEKYRDNWDIFLQ